MNTRRLAVFAAALWWGSMTAIGFVAVPLLFRHLPTPALAGNMAAHLFTAQSWIGVACGLALIFCARKVPPARASTAQAAMVLILGGMLLALLGEFAAAPRIRARENLPLWHAVGTGLFALQWLCAAALLWRLAPRMPAEDSP